MSLSSFLSQSAAKTTQDHLLLHHSLTKNISTENNATHKTVLAASFQPVMRRLSSSTSPPPIREEKTQEGGGAVGNTVHSSRYTEMIAASTINTPPAVTMDSNLTELLRRSQKAMPSSADTSMMQNQQLQLASSNASNNSLDFSTALAAAVAAGYARQATTGNLSSADVMLLLQQQQQQQQQHQRACLSAAERLASVDGGNSFLQERLGVSNMSGLSSSMMDTLQSSPSLGAYTNTPLDLSQVLLAYQQAIAFGNASSFGTVPTPTQNASDLSRMIMMLRGQGNYVSALSSGTSSSAAGTASSASMATFSNSAKATVTKSPELDKKRPAEAVPKKHKRTPKKPKLANPGETTATPRDMPCVLYTKEDDDYLTPYQCLLRKQLELFVADAEDVRCSSQQGRTTNIQVGQVGLRCRHCEGGLASRTKGAVYYSHSVDGIYQVGQNIGKVHLAERCYRISDDIRRQLIALRNDSRRASSGKAYWSSRIRALGVCEEGNILKIRSAGQDEVAKEEATEVANKASNNAIKKESIATKATKKLHAETTLQAHGTKTPAATAVGRQE
jgi:hypothetical protein